jgi:hypothetical protein
MSLAAYATTTVPVERSQAEIRKLLQDYGATRLAFGEEREGNWRWAAVTFTTEAHGVRLRVPLTLVNEHDVRAKAVRAHIKTVEDIRDEMYKQEERRIWRVLAWNLKARMVAVQEGLESFEQAFLPHLINPRTNLTVYEELAHNGRIELDAPLLAIPEQVG